MNDQRQEIFLLEVEKQCKYALIAADDLKRALKTQDLDRLWYSLHSFLVAVGNISKLLWPSRPKMPRKAKIRSKPQVPNRGGELRAHLSVPADSPLAARTFRDHFEHFDERLEAWAMQARPGPFVDSCVGPPEQFFAGLTAKDFLRHFDPRTYTLTFRGEVYHLLPIIEAVRGLYRKLMEAGPRRRKRAGP